MSDTHSRRGEFCHVAENLYRYSSSGIYYARYRANGKEVSRSLRTAVHLEVGGSFQFQRWESS